MPVATISNLTVRYGSKVAVNDLSVQVPKGASGCSAQRGGQDDADQDTARIRRPAAGRAAASGWTWPQQGLRIRQKIGLMPEQDCHIPGMNAVTFVAYAGELAGMPAKDAMRRAHETLEYCGLGEARYRNIETYSTGMKQRIKLAQALVHGPKLLFLDEPTNGLDPAGRDEMLALVRDISHGKGVNVLVSSHLLPDIERTCDQVIVMRDGRGGDAGTGVRPAQDHGNPGRGRAEDRVAAVRRRHGAARRESAASARRRSTVSSCRTRLGTSGRDAVRGGAGIRARRSADSSRPCGRWKTSSWRRWSNAGDRIAGGNGHEAPPSPISCWTAGRCRRCAAGPARRPHRRPLVSQLRRPAAQSRASAGGSSPFRACGISASGGGSGCSWRSA